MQEREKSLFKKPQKIKLFSEIRDQSRTRGSLEEYLHYDESEKLTTNYTQTKVGEQERKAERYKV